MERSFGAGGPHDAGRSAGIEEPRRAGKGLVVFVEIDRCATDAIQALTGVSLGKRTLKHVDYGKMAATFVDVSRGTAVLVNARPLCRPCAGEGYYRPS